MKIFAFMTRKNCVRSIFIFGVLTGLFFSGGEGVQLLPFPVAEIDNIENARSILDKNTRSYAFSILHLGSQSPLVKSKFQKQANLFALAGHFIFGWLDRNANIRLLIAHRREKANLSPISHASVSQADRAPPKT